MVSGGSVRELVRIDASAIIHAQKSDLETFARLQMLERIQHRVMLGVPQMR